MTRDPLAILARHLGVTLRELRRRMTRDEIAAWMEYLR